MTRIAIAPVGLRARLAADPGSVPLRAELANLSLEIGLLEDAETLYQSILRDVPGLAQVHYNLGLVYDRQQRLSAAAAAYRAAIEAGMTDALVWNNLGVVYKDRGDYRRATEAFEAALAADPRHYYAAFNLASMQINAGDVDGGHATLRIARSRAAASGESTAVMDTVLKDLSRP